MIRSSLQVLYSSTVAAALCIAPVQLLSAQSTPATNVAPDITVLDAGTAPRQALRFRLVKGDSESGAARQSITMNMEMGGMAMPAQSLPATIANMQYTVGEVAANGTAAITAEFVSMDIDDNGADPMLVSAMRPQLAGMNGMKMRYSISPTGGVSNMQFDGGNPEMMQALGSLGSMDQTGVTFPTEPVGVGARWKAARPVTQNGLTIQQDVEYVVKSLSADSVVLDMMLAQSARNQVMNPAGMPAGAQATVRSMEGKGVATLVVRFNSVQPSMDMKMDVKMALDLDMNGDVNSVNQTMVMEMKSGPVAKP